MPPAPDPIRSRPTHILLVGTALLAFIPTWRATALVVRDLAGTAFYVGGAVEQAIGPAAPWFLLAVMTFGYAIRSVYIESCALFVRGGVYRVVREGLGAIAARFAVATLLFNFIVTGPISAVAAGHYLVGFLLDFLRLASPATFGSLGLTDPYLADGLRRWGALAMAMTLLAFFTWQSLRGAREPPFIAVAILVAITLLIGVLSAWSLYTLWIDGPRQAIPFAPSLEPKPLGPDDQARIDPLGFLAATDLGDRLLALEGWDWFSLLGALGVLVAFGHAILALSGEETLAQVYRDVESPKLRNFQRAALAVWIYGLMMTAGLSFFAATLIPAETRFQMFENNLLGGLALHLAGPTWLLLVLEAFVALTALLILAGAIHTAFVGSLGVLQRVAEEDGIPQWLMHPHPRHGTPSRLLFGLAALQAGLAVVSLGHTVWLAELYTFGVVWCFLFQAAATLVLRLRDGRTREYKVPLNPRLAGREIPLGLLAILFVLVLIASVNLCTHVLATVGGLSFTGACVVLFSLERRLQAARASSGKAGDALADYAQESAGEVSAEALGLTRRYRKLVAVRAVENLFLVEKALAETDPEITGVVVLTVKDAPIGESQVDDVRLDRYDAELMSAVVERAEKFGLQVIPLVLATNDPLYAIFKTAKDIEAHELILGASRLYSSEEQLERSARTWLELHGGEQMPLTIRVLEADREVHFDIGGGHRVPKAVERRARSAADLRAAGLGVRRVLILHDGSSEHSDLFLAVASMLDQGVELILASAVAAGTDLSDGIGVVLHDEDRARRIGHRVLRVETGMGGADQLLDLARQYSVDLIVVPILPQGDTAIDERAADLARRAPCRVFLATLPVKQR